MLYINDKKWYNITVVAKTKREVKNMLKFNYFNLNAENDYNKNNYFYDVEYLPSIFDGKVDKESLF